MKIVGYKENGKNRFDIIFANGQRWFGFGFADVKSLANALCKEKGKSHFVHERKGSTKLYKVS